MGSAPKVTVLMPVYNRADYVGQAVASVLAQTFTDFELLVVDDGSTDGSVGVVEAFADPRIRLVRNDTNLGVPKTRNKGLALAQGTYVAMLDSDDRALPHRLARQVVFLDQRPGVVLIGANTRGMGRRRWRPKDLLRQRPLAPDAVRARLLFRCCIAQTTIMARADVLRRFGYAEDFSAAQDFELFVRLADAHPIANLPDVLVQYRRHAGQMSERRDLVADRQLLILKRQLERLGMEHTDEELHGHFLLARPRSWHRADAAYLGWAEAWLCRLEQANRSAGRYPEAVFRATLGQVWLDLCARAPAAACAALGRRAWRSPLNGAARAALAARWAGPAAS